MTSVLTYIGGVVVGIAAVTIVGYALLWMLRGVFAVAREFTKIPDVFWMPESGARRRNAAAILTARRVGGIRLPFSVVLVWRSDVRWATNEATRAVDIALMQALREGGFHDEETKAADRQVETARKP